MTDLVAPAWMDTRANGDVEHWHATVLPGGLIASVIVRRKPDGTWTARAQLRDRTLRPTSDDRERGPFDTHEAALSAGQAAVLALQQAATEPLVESLSADVSRSAVGLHRSQVARRCVHSKRSRQPAQGTQSTRAHAVKPERRVGTELSVY